MFKLIFFILIFWTKTLLALELQIKITGVKEDLQKVLTSTLGIERISKEQNLTLNKIENIYLQELKKIKHTLAALGYYNSQISPSLVNIIPKQIWRANYTIELGPATKIKQINMRITGAAAKNVLFKNNKLDKLKLNSILTHKNYEDTKEELIVLLHSAGFLSAKYTSSQMRVDRNTNTAEIVLFIDSGPQYIFGAVTYINPPMDLAFLNRIIPFKAGQAYTSNALRELRNNLNAVDLFEKIKIDPMPDLLNKDNLVVPINVSLNLKKSKRYTASIGYGTESSIRGTFGWQNRRVTNTGHKISAVVNSSKIRKKMQVNYIIPGQQPATDSYTLNSTLQQEKIDEIYYRKAEFGVSKNKDKGKYRRILSIRKLIETFKDLQLNKNTNVNFLLGEAYYNFTNLETIEERDYGHKFEFNVVGATNKLLSKTNLLKLRIDSKAIYPLITDARLILKNSIGTIFTPKFSLTPLSLRYFAGGEDSIRGFKLDSIGQMVTSSTGSIVNIGGKRLFLLSAEVDKPVWEKISAAVFIDTGTASYKFKEKFSTGAGIGLRWRSQIGALKFDIARQVSKIQNRKLHFMISFDTDL